MPDTTVVNDVVGIAAKVSALVDEIQTAIAGFEAPSPDRTRKMAANAKFGPALIPPMTTAAENYAALRDRNFFTVDEARETLAIHQALSALATRLNALAATIAFEDNRTVADLVMRMMQAYEWCQRHLHSGEGAEVRPYLDEAAAALKKILNRRAKPQAPPPAQGFLARGVQSAAEEENVLALVREEIEREQ